MPASIVAYTGMDAQIHGIEAYGVHAAQLFYRSAGDAVHQASGIQLLKNLQRVIKTQEQKCIMPRPLPG